MGEEKFASLSSGLLARKGAAKPAMRRQGFINPEGDVTEDLGWNDMGIETPQPLTGETEFHGEAPLPEVRKQQVQLAEGLNGSGVEPIDPVGETSPTTVDETPPTTVDEASEEVIEPKETSSYPSDGHGGLSPMKASEPETNGHENAVEESRHEEPGFEVPESDNSIRLSDQSPLSIKKSQQSAPVEVDVPAREKVAFTLRLDRERHLKLRLASAVTNQSAQRLVTEALDKFLEQHPEVQALTGPMSDAKKH